MNELDEALMTRRAERMLYEAGQKEDLQINVMVVEGIHRERMPFDDHTWNFTPIENVGLAQLREKYKEIER